MSKAPTQCTQQELVDLLEDLIAKAERGEPFRAGFRYQTTDGKWHDVALGYDSDEDRAAALTALRRMLGHLH